MILETKYLRIVPLTAEQFRLFINSVDEMEQALGLNPSIEKLDKHTKIAMEVQYDLMMENPAYNLLLTSWQIVLKSENISVGSMCFKNIPDNEGIIEIGYGINRPYRNKGYMTETVKTMSEWGLQQKGVKSIIAITDSENKASQSVLSKSGFILYRKEKNILWWKIEK